MKKKYSYLWALVVPFLFALFLWYTGRGTPGEAEKAQLDLSRIDRGVVSVRYAGDSTDRVKCQISKTGGMDYNYDLDNTGEWETFALTQGEGEYTLRVLEQLEGNRYTPVYTYTIDLKLDDPLFPYLESNQFVRYYDFSGCVTLAGELTAAMETDSQKIDALLTYVAGALEYDDEKAATVPSGYLPDVDLVLEEGKGICFDYAALLCAMLRAQGIPARMAVGDCGEAYHAWVEVWSRTEGEAGGIPLVPGAWTRLDPTFLSQRGQTAFILNYIQEDGNYQTRYLY